MDQEERFWRFPTLFFWYFPQKLTKSSNYIIVYNFNFNKYIINLRTRYSGISCKSVPHSPFYSCLHPWEKRKCLKQRILLWKTTYCLLPFLHMEYVCYAISRKLKNIHFGKVIHSHIKALFESMNWLISSAWVISVSSSVWLPLPISLQILVDSNYTFLALF